MIYGLASAFGRFFGLILTPIYTRIFTPDDYGAIDLITVSTYFISIFCATEIWAGVSRHYIESSKDVKEKSTLVSTGLFYLLLVSAVFLTLVYIFTADILTILTLDKKYWISFYIAVATIPFSIVFTYFNILLRFEKRPWLFFIAITAQLISNATVSIVLIMVFRIGTNGFFIGQLAGFAVALLVFFSVLRNHIKALFSFRLLGRLLQFSLPIVPAVIAVWLNAYANRFVMLKYLSLHDIGVYAVGLKMASIFLFLEYALRLAWTPFLYELITEPDYINNINKFFKVLVKVLLVVFIAVSLFTREIIDVLAPVEYQKAHTIAAVLCIPALLLILNLVLSAGPLIAKKTYYESFSQISGMAINLLTLILTVPLWGIEGAAISYLIGSLITSFLYYYYSNKLIKLTVPRTMTMLTLVMLITAAYVASSWDFTLLYKIVFLFVVIVPVSCILLYKDSDLRTIYSKIISKYLIKQPQA